MALKMALKGFDRVLVACSSVWNISMLEELRSRLGVSQRVLALHGVTWGAVDPGGGDPHSPAGYDKHAEIDWALADVDERPFALVGRLHALRYFGAK